MTIHTTLHKLPVSLSQSQWSSIVDTRSGPSLLVPSPLDGVLYVEAGWPVASFPGSPRARTKSGKERGEPGKIYHVRNVIGRENLITCGRTNEHAHALLTI